MARVKAKHRHLEVADILTHPIAPRPIGSGSDHESWNRQLLVSLDTIWTMKSVPPRFLPARFLPACIPLVRSLPASTGQTLLLVSLAICLVTPARVDAREWTDQSGAYRIEAELVDVQKGVARLRRPDGSIVSVPLGKLSEADQQFIAQRSAAPETAAALTVFRKHCYSCHGEGGSNEGGMNYAIDLERLVETEKVVSGTPEDSPMLERMVDGDMPPEGTEPRPTAEEIAAVRAWIRAGARPVAKPKREFISNADILKAIRIDLDSVNERDRRFTRYFTITHLYNAQRSNDELQTYRLAIAKLLNSLSWERRLVHPRPIDPAATIFRIDIRDLRWSTETWIAIRSLYPYAIRASGPDFQRVTSETRSSLPFVRGDWFVAVASRPPLYHAVLGLPETSSQLQRLLKIDFAQDVRQERVARAGFNESGISVHPRIIERHETSDGACWVSYDFAGAAGDKNFFSNPLQFAADGGEIIFNLPNGLQAYYLADAAGTRLDKAPTSIVKDPSQADGSVVNGLSCMRCHSAGLIAKDDEVRRNVLVNSPAFRDNLETIKAIYPDQSVLDDAFEKDTRRFTEAMAELGIRRTSVTGEPVFNMAARFEDELDASLAAAELGMTRTKLLGRIQGRLDLQRLIGTLRLPGGTIKRDAFESAFGSLVGPLSLGSYMRPTHRVAPRIGAGGVPAIGGAPAIGGGIAEGGGRWFNFGGRSRYPSFLEATRVLANKDGLYNIGRDQYVRTKKGDFLAKDFTFEIVFTITKDDSIMFVGLGEGRGRGSYKEPASSVNLRIHPPVTHKGEVALSKTGVGGEGMGRIPNAGTHRAIITKEGKSVTFKIDIDNDGDGPDDLERTIPDIEDFAPFLHSKNSHLFFGGGGTFNRLRLNQGAAVVAPAAKPPAARAPIAALPLGVKPIGRRTTGFNFANAMLGKDGLVVKPQAVVRSRRADFLRGDFHFDLVLTVPPGSARQPLDRPIFIGIGDGSYDRLHEVERCVRLRINPPDHFQGDGSVNIGKTGADGRLDRNSVQEIGKLREAGTHRISIIKSGSAITFAVDVDNDGESPDDFESTIPDIGDYAPFLHTKNSAIFFGGDAVFTHLGLR